MCYTYREMGKKAKFFLSLLVVFLLIFAYYRSEWEKATRQFSLAYTYLTSLFYEEPNTKDLVFNAIRGMLEGLDPHSRFLDPDTLATMREEQAGKFYGLGIQITMINGKITVVAVLKGTPAHRLGFMPGDIITHVDGKSIEGLTTEQVVRLLRGPKGTKVRVTIQREGYDKPLEFVVTRAEIPLNSVRYSFMYNRDVGYVAIYNFGQTTPKEIEKAVRQLISQGMKVLVLDLRGNPGGSLSAAVEVADLFIKKPQLIVYTKGKTKDSTVFYFANKDGYFEDLPLIILINHTSASASEVVSGAIQDHDRGILIGNTTWGKGLVQTLFALSKDSALALTTAKYYTPSGRCIQRDYSDWEAYFWAKPKNNHEGPIYKTDKGREVYGGGGIEPDYKVPPQYLKELAARMRSKGLFFRWARKFAKGQTPLARKLLPQLKDKDIFHLKITDEFLKDYLNFVRKNSDLKFTEKDLKESKKDILFEIHYELANALKGLDTGMRVLLKYDAYFKKALELKKEAIKMAKDYAGR